MKLRTAWSLLLLLCGLGQGLAQVDSCHYSVEGQILDIDTKAPLPYVTVKVKDTDKYTLTDTDGTFFIDGLCNKVNTVIVSCFGYCDTICEQHHQHGKVPHIFLTQKVIELESVVIAAEKSAVDGAETITQATLKKEDLRADPTRSLAAALSAEEGVTMISTGSNVQLPVIHGLYGNRVLMLNNGLKHGFQNWGTDHAPEIDLSSLHSITVLKGAAGVRFGPEALGGAIVTTPNPLYLNEPFYTAVGTGYQTNGRGAYSNIEIGQGLDNWSYYLTGNYTQIGDRHAPDYSLTNSGKIEKSLNAGLRYYVGRWNFKFNYSFVDQNLALLRSSIADSGNAFINAVNSDEPNFIRPFSYQINEPNQLTQHHLGKIEVDWWYSDDAKLTFRVGQQLNKREEYDVRRNADSPIIDLDLASTDYQIEWKHPDWKKFDGIIGLQMFTQNNDNNPGTGTTPFIPNYNSTRYSGFIIESLKSGKNTFEIGLRLDYEYNNVRGRETNQNIFRDDYHFTNLTFSVGYVRELSENTNFRTNFGTAWRTPNMAELFSFGQHGFRTSFGLLRYYTSEEGSLRTNRVTKMNESAVMPEKGYKWINEWQIQQSRNHFTLTAYTHYIQHFIFERPVTVIGTIRGPMPVFIFDQTDALFFGTDFTWEKDWTSQWSGRFSFSYLWSRNIEQGEPLINQPPITTAYQLEWRTPDFWKVSESKLGLRPSYTFQQFQAPRTVRPDEIISGIVSISPESEIFDFKDAPEGYFLLDLFWQFRLGKVSGSFRVQNVLNTRYRDYLNDMRYFADEPGTNFLLNINYRFEAKDKRNR